MSTVRSRLLVAAVAIGVAGVFTAMFPVASATSAAAAAKPPPGNEGPAGPPARMPNGKVAAPPRVVSPQVSTGCPAAPYGVNSYAPGFGKTVALTFDDGPGASTAGVLSILAKYGLPATFFNIGQNMAARPALVRQEAGMGYMLGNHTWDHPIMSGLSASAQAAEMDRTSAEQKSLAGSLPCAFRPPYGYPDYNSTTLSLAQQRRMKVWLWSVDTEDWKAEGSSSQYWVDRIIRLAEQEGGVLRHPVVLMHNAPSGDPATVRALPTIINYFHRHGYTFVNLAGQTGWSSRQASQAAAQANGTVDVFWKAMDGGLGHHFYAAGSGWSGPQEMSGEPVAGEPSVTTSTPGTVDVFWEGVDGHLWHRFYTHPGGWHGPEQMPALTIGGPPAAVAQADGAVDVFWRGTDNHLWHLGYRPGSGWSGRQDLGGDLASNPAPAASSPGTVDVFWEGTDGHLWHAFANHGTHWYPPASLGMGTLGSRPWATAQPSGTIDVFWRGTDTHLWHAYYAQGRGWSGPGSLGGDLYPVS